MLPQCAAMPNTATSAAILLTQTWTELAMFLRSLHRCVLGLSVVLLCLAALGCSKAEPRKQNNRERMGSMVVEEYKKDLKSSDPAVRRRAIPELARRATKNNGVRSTLEKAAKSDADAGVREEAKSALARLKE